MRLAVRIIGALALMALVNCDGCGDNDGTSCTVAQLDAGGVVFTCGDDQATLPTAEPCSVDQTEDEVTLSCPDGSEVTLPIGGSSGGDAGSCNVTSNADGTITIRCPDGSMATIPGTGPTDGGAADGGARDAGDAGGDTGQLPLVHYTGATTTACGSCHDAPENKSHFATQTSIVGGLPVEGCPTCHKEGSLVPVSTAHARPEFGPPGFQVEILDAGIDPATRKAAVSLRLRTSDGGVLDRTGVSLNYVIAHVPLQTLASSANTVAGPYTSYLTRTRVQIDNPDYPLEGTPREVQQPTGESNGTYTNPGPGLYDYTFFDAGIPEGYADDHTHVVAVYATRTVGPVRWVSNATRNFVPNNPAATPMKRSIVQTATCNKCHNPLQAHGGSRQEVQLCLTCHSQGALDPETGNTIDFNIMVHKIHMGARLPSVKAGGKYGIVGNSNSTHDYSHVEYPQDILNCQSCHTSADDDRWVSNGTQAVCMSCHENIYEPGVHAFNIQQGVTCGNSSCHSETGGAATGAPDAREAHLTFLNTDPPIFDITIVSATVANADAAPALRVKALSGTRLSGATLPLSGVDKFGMLEVFFNGPNTNYVSHGHNIKQYGKAQLVGLAATTTPGEFTFSLPETLREAAGTAGDVTKDSYTVSIRASYDPSPGAAPTTDVVDMIKNPTAAISAAGTAVPRKQVVDTAKCNNCHGNLVSHGGDILVHNVEQCVMCHTSTLETSLWQGENLNAGPTTSLRFSQLVHRAHAGGMATDPYVLYGYSVPGTMHPEFDLSNLAFPGDRKDCLTCHIAGTNVVPVSASTAPTQTLILDANGQPIKE